MVIKCLLEFKFARNSFRLVPLVGQLLIVSALLSVWFTLIVPKFISDIIIISNNNKYSLKLSFVTSEDI